MHHTATHSKSDGCQPNGNGTRLELDNFQAEIHRITKEDRPLLHELTVGVYWPHRDHDLDFFISLGQGYLAVDEIGRAMGSAMHFQIGDDFAAFGMMVTAPRLQTQGAGRWLLNQIMSECEGRDLRLNATRAGYWLYESAGFIPIGLIYQHQGIARPIYLPEAVEGVEIRPYTQNDLARIATFDATAFGADRTVLLKPLSELSKGCVALRNGEIVGYTLIRSFGRGKVIGPIVTDDERIAMQMIAPFIQENAGSFLRVDTPMNKTRFTSFLSAAGMGLYDTVTEMYVGKQRRALEGTQLFGLAAQSLG